MATIQEKHTIEVDSLELEVLKSLLRQGLYTQEKHDEVVQEIVMDLAQDFGIEPEEAYNHFVGATDKFRSLAGEGDW